MWFFFLFTKSYSMFVMLLFCLNNLVRNQNFIWIFMVFLYYTYWKTASMKHSLGFFLSFSSKMKYLVFLVWSSSFYFSNVIAPDCNLFIMLLSQNKKTLLKPPKIYIFFFLSSLNIFTYYFLIDFSVFSFYKSPSKLEKITFVREDTF